MALTFPQEPVLARHVSALPGPDALPGGCAYEPKFDGYRALLFVGQDACRVQSRRGHDISDAFDDVAASAHAQLPAGLVLDGELVVWSGGVLSFADLQRRAGQGRDVLRRRAPASFVAFDVLQVADLDVRARPLSERRQLLETVMADVGGALQLTPQTSDVELARQWLGDYASADVGIEGLVVKGHATTYRGGTRQWQKLRLRATTEALVGAVAGTLSSPDHLVLGRLGADGVLHQVGTTTALSPTQRAEVAELVSPATHTHPWAGDAAVASGRWGRDEGLPVHPVEPALVAEVSVDGSTDRGRWRHPVRLVRLRADLGPDEVPTLA